MNLDLVRKSPTCGNGRHQTAILSERKERETRAVEQARIRHEQWLANGAARPPDMWDERAALEADRAHAEEVRLLAELRRELEAERQQSGAERPVVYIPARLRARKAVT